MPTEADAFEGTIVLFLNEAKIMHHPNHTEGGNQVAPRPARAGGGVTVRPATCALRARAGLRGAGRGGARRTSSSKSGRASRPPPLLLLFSLPLALL